MGQKPIFTVDWEDWNHALHVEGEKRIKEPTIFLLDLLDKYKVKAKFYILGRTQVENPKLYKEIFRRFHLIASHGYYHDHDESKRLNAVYEGYDFRSPYWDTTPMPWPPSGGFFFRIMPIWYLKWAINKSGIFWIHPHDVMIKHPKLKNPLLNWKRTVGLKQSRLKLDRLMKEVDWDEPKAFNRIN